ncbi:PepSY-like domain-containing protein [Capnocytophaga sputigena]|uniref:PepSY-like domain-containing protein n=1 Tax=Capnocytophaga sputigena TaxID=1019 RepID=UPI0028E58A3B|nr:PepSY-like domain-containing protein [Capnocytophaga sputigena]
MKRFLLLIAATLTFSAASAQDSKVTFNDLPADAINFVRQHFLIDHIASLWKDTDYNDEEYTVIFRDGLEIEFNGNGDWKELKARHGKVPDHVVPEKILAHVRATFPFESIKEVSRNLTKKRYEAELTNEQELKFDENFNFIGVK